MKCDEAKPRPPCPMVEADPPPGLVVSPEAVFEALVDIFGLELEELLGGKQDENQDQDS